MLSPANSAPCSRKGEAAASSFFCGRFLWLAACVLLMSGCISPQPRTGPPDFAITLPRPVNLQIHDRRPEAQKGTVRDADWIYFQPQQADASELLVAALGNALTVLNAAPGYVVQNPEAAPSGSGVWIELELLDGYSRWPVDVNQRGTTVPVEASMRVGYKLFIDGRGIRQGTLTHAPPNFNVQVAIIQRHNVRRIISDALTHQFNKVTTMTLDDLLWRLEHAWPES